MDVNIVRHERTKFSLLAKQGIFGTLTPKQLIVLLVAVAGLLLSLVAGGLTLTILTSPVWVGLIVIGVVSSGGEPLVHKLIAGFGFLKRKRTAANVATMPAAYSNVKTLSDEGSKVVIIDNFGLPGRLGKVQLIEAEPSGAFVIDPHAGSYSFSVRLHSKAWVLSDVEEQIQVREKFESFLSSLPHKPALVEVCVRARSDNTMSSWVQEYVKAYDRQSNERGGKFVEEEYSVIANKLASSATINSYVLTMTFALPANWKQKHQGYWRLANVLETEYKALVKLFTPVGLIVQKQLTLVELRNEILRGLDPVTASERSRGQGFLSDENISAGISTIEESFTDVRVDETFHQTFWISEWPRVDVEPGFLSAFSDRGDFTRCLTLQYRPLDIDKALAKIRRDRTSYLSVVDLYEKANQVIPYHLEQQHEDLLTREEQLTAGAGVFKFRGFLTISAADRETIENAAQIVKTAAALAHTEIRTRPGQQLACLVQSVLPFGVL